MLCRTTLSHEPREVLGTHPLSVSRMEPSKQDKSGAFLRSHLGTPVNGPHAVDEDRPGRDQYWVFELVQFGELVVRICTLAGLHETHRLGVFLADDVRRCIVLAQHVGQINYHCQVEPSHVLAR